MRPICSGNQFVYSLVKTSQTVSWRTLMRACLVLVVCSKLLQQVPGAQALRGVADWHPSRNTANSERYAITGRPAEGLDARLQQAQNHHDHIQIQQTRALLAITTLPCVNCTQPGRSLNSSTSPPSPSISPSPQRSASPSPSPSPIVSSTAPGSPSPEPTKPPSPEPLVPSPSSPTVIPSPSPLETPRPSPVPPPDSAAPSPSQASFSPSPDTADEDDPTRLSSLVTANATSSTNSAPGSSQSHDDPDKWKLVISIVIPTLTGIAAILTIAYTGWKWWHMRKATIASKRLYKSASQLPDIRTFTRQPQPLFSASYSHGPVSSVSPRMGVKPLYPDVRL